MSPWFLVPIVAVVGGIVLLSYRTSRRSRRGARELGARPGWSYYERDGTVLADFGGWPFTPGLPAHHVVRGSHRGRAVVAFRTQVTQYALGRGLGGFVREHVRAAERRAAGTQDLFEAISESFAPVGWSDPVVDGRRRAWIAVVATEMPEALPGFLVRIQLPTDRIFPGLSSNDLLVGERYFDAAYRVRAEHPQLARDLLIPANQQLLLRFSPFARGPHRGPGLRTLDDDPATGFTMWTAGRKLIVVSGAQLDREGHDAALDLMADFLDNVPSWVWDVAAGRRPAPSPASSNSPAPPPVRARPPDPPLSPSPISEAGGPPDRQPPNVLQ